MHNSTINKKQCNEQYLVYLNTVTAMNNLINSINKESGAFTDYLRMVQELLLAYDPDTRLADCEQSINKIIHHWMMNT